MSRTGHARGSPPSCGSHSGYRSGVGEECQARCLCFRAAYISGFGALIDFIRRNLLTSASPWLPARQPPAPPSHASAAHATPGRAWPTPLPCACARGVRSLVATSVPLSRRVRALWRLRAPAVRPPVIAPSPGARAPWRALCFSSPPPATAP